MEKKWHDIPTTEVRIEPGRASCRPMETVVLTLNTDTTDAVGIELGLPLDVHAAPPAPVIRGGTLEVELRAALPGRYTVTIDRVTGGAGKYLIKTEGNKVHLFEGKPYPVAVLDVRWGKMIP
jgi:hypothetical protein